MNTLEQAVMESRIESAENRIRSEHNDLESKKFFGKKTYLPYRNDKLLAMVDIVEATLRETRK